MMNNYIEIHYKKIKMLAIILLAIPAFLFFLGWLKLYIALPCSVMLGLSVFYASKTEDKTISIKLSSLILIAVVVLIWLILSGQGSLFTQKRDFEYRNPLFKDLINYKWPVRFNDVNDSSLVYYVGYWLLPALFGKFFLLFTDFKTTWFVSNIFLLIWSFILVYTTILLVLFVIDSKKRRSIPIVLAVFILFSGMDILGVRDFSVHGTHLELWSYIFQYSSMSTQLCWVFNQAIPTWLACSLLLNEKDEKHGGLIVFSLLTTSPFPFVGNAVYLLFRFITHSYFSKKKNQLSSYLKNTFSLTNILSAIAILPVFSVYYMNNSSSAKSATSGIIYSKFIEDPPLAMMYYVAFILLEFLVLLLLLLGNKYKVETFYSLIFLCFVPFIQVGHSLDFCMRASIPGLFFVMIILMDYFVELSDKKINDFKVGERIKIVLLIIMFIIGCATPITEYKTSISRFIKYKGKNITQYDYADTILDITNDNVYNFICENTSDKFFYKYVAKC